MAQMVYKTNLVVLAGGGDSPKWPQGKVMVYDDYQQKIIGELTFSTVVKSIKASQDILAVILYQKTYLFNLMDLTLIDCIDTCENPLGHCELAFKPTSTNQEGITFVASLDLEKGSVRLRRMEDKTNEYVVPCHQESLSALTLSETAEYFATACTNGIYIRIWMWKEDATGKMDTPQSIFAIEIQNRDLLITELQLSYNMKYLATTLQQTTTITPNEESANSREEISSFVHVYGPINID